jgi:cell division protein FtsW (lipid II flippase)
MAFGAVTVAALGASPGPDSAFFQTMAMRHALFIAAGFAVMIVGAAAVRALETLARYRFTVLGLALVLTVGTAMMGNVVNGARLWLAVGPLRFQPSEVVRVLLAVFAASYLYERRHLVVAPWRVGRLELPAAPYLAPFGLAVTAAAGVLVLQNDLGMAALIGVGAVASFVSIAPSREGVISSVVVLALGAAAGYVAVPRIRERVAGWLNPWADPAGRGFQFVQADYGLAGGGLIGAGRGAGATRIPEVHTDFVLAGIGSVFGVLGALAVIALTAVLICRCVLAALRAADGFQALLVLTLAAVMGIQVLLIVGGTLRVVPLTGVTLPLVSYGGSSMLATSFSIGLILGIGAKGHDGGRQLRS